MAWIRVWVRTIAAAAAFAATLGVGAIGAAHAEFRAADRTADLYIELNRCLQAGDDVCLNSVGRTLANSLENPRQRALMLGRFALIDWAGGDTLAGNTGFLRAWAIAREDKGPGCYDRIETMFALERLASAFGHRTAARFVLRGLIAEAEGWTADPGKVCQRPASEEHWLAQIARRQNVLGDKTGVVQTLNLAKRWAIAAPEAAPPLAPHAEQAARLLADFGRAPEAGQICELRREALRTAAGPDAALGAAADAEWQGLACLRRAGLKEPARAAYREFIAAKAKAIGLAATPEESSAGAEDTLSDVLWDLVQDLRWDDPVLYPYTPDFEAKGPRACFERPTARCLTVHAMDYVETAQRTAKRRSGAPWSAGSLDGFARFLVGAGEDPVGAEARDWFLTQTETAPIEDLSMLVGNAIRTGDLVWARTIFYAWYGETGESYFKDLTGEPQNSKAARSAKDEDPGADADAWPLHVAWSIASLVADLDPAFEPEELSEFAEAAWDRGVAELRPLKDIPRIELIDADERSGTHLLNLCFRNAFGEWAADLFTKSHLPARAAEAQAMLPEAARDCAFARRSVGPLLRSAEWFQHKDQARVAREAMLEAADRLTRPHYHVYADADPALGGSALAAAALGLSRGIIVPAPYDAAF